MLSKIVFIYIFLDLIKFTLVIGNIISIDDYRPINDIDIIIFRKGEKTKPTKEGIEPTERLKCLDKHNYDHCTKFQYESIACELIDNQNFECNFTNLPFYLSIDSSKVSFQQVTLINSTIKVIKETAYLEYYLKLNWFYDVALLLFFVLLCSFIFTCLSFTGLLFLICGVKRKRIKLFC